jgi:hypothetical protein
MANRVILLMGLTWLAALGAGCSSTNQPELCNGGCLCFRTPQDCPAGCYPAYQKTDTGSVFVCENFPPSDAGPPRVPANHRTAGSMCPQDRGMGVMETSPQCLQGAGPVVPNCVGDTDCTNGANGRCLRFGGPACSDYCSYDECTSDSDCAGNVPCACRSSSSDSGPNACATASNCRVDADCGPGGFCSPSLVNKICQCSDPKFCTPADLAGCSGGGCSCSGNCGSGYFCHTPKDSCLDDSDCGSGLCTFDLTGQTWLCVSLCIGPS